MIFSGKPSDVLTYSVTLEHLKYDEVEDKDAISNNTSKQKLNEDEDTSIGTLNRKLVTDKRAQQGKLVEEEVKDVGVVKLHVYKAYWRAVGNVLAPSVLIALFLMQGKVTIKL